ncbi:hypothetical protein PQI23_09220 [Leucobacter sp. USCH14]|uniref:hypothetical protein n=1 Tax=Leucobacter sp. USCH14 TaxID=3024838 RepID=UPI00309A381E
MLIASDNTVACSFGYHLSLEQPPEVHLLRLSDGGHQSIRIDDALDFSTVAATRNSFVTLTINSGSGDVSVTAFESSGQRGWSRVIDEVTFADGQPRDAYGNYARDSYDLFATSDHIVVSGAGNRSVVLDASTGEPRTPADSSGLNFVDGRGVQVSANALAIETAATNAATVYVDGQTAPSLVEFTIEPGEGHFMDSACGGSGSDDGPIVLCRTNCDQTEVVMFLPGSSEPMRRVLDWGNASLTDVSEFGVLVSSREDESLTIRLDPVTGETTETACQLRALGPEGTAIEDEHGSYPWTTVGGCDHNGNIWETRLTGQWYLQYYGSRITLFSENEFTVLK